MESTLSTISLMPLGKEEIQDFANKTIAEVKSGNVNALNLKAQLKAIEKAIELIDSGTKEEQLREMAKYGKQTEMLGFKIEQVEVAAKYDFTKCKDPEWNDIATHIDEINEKKKKREQMLKTLSKSITVAIEETGEIVTIYPPLKTSTTGLKFTLK